MNISPAEPPKYAVEIKYPSSLWSQIGAGAAWCMGGPANHRLRVILGDFSHEYVEYTETDDDGKVWEWCDECGYSRAAHVPQPTHFGCDNCGKVTPVDFREGTPMRVSTYAVTSPLGDWVDGQFVPIVKDGTYAHLSTNDTVFVFCTQECLKDFEEGWDIDPEMVGL